MIKRLFILAIILYNTAIFAQDNENPYAMFGYEPKISDTIYSKTELFYLHNSDTKAFVQTLAFDFENGKVYLYDDNNLLLATILLEKEDMARFTTPDPLAEKHPNVSPYAYCMNNPVRYIDPDGREAWEITNKWSDDYINKFINFVSDQTNQYVKDGEMFTCEDFALSLLIDFASTNGLPVTINNGSGIYDASSENYTDAATFKNDVLTTTGARDLQNDKNTVPSDISMAKGGDIIVNRNNKDVGTHIQVVTSGFYIDNTDFVNGISISQGNSGILNIVPGSSSILGAGNPNSSFYTGKPIEKGWIDVNANVYFNNTKGRTIRNYSNTKNIEVRRWNFKRF